MDIPASKLLESIHPDAVSIVIRNSSLDQNYEIGVECLKILVASGYVRGVASARGYPARN